MIVELRSATDADRAFLEALYAASRDDEFARAGLEPAARRALCAQQFAAQEASYRQRFPRAAYAIVLVNGVAAGRLVVDRGATVHVVDILVAKQFQGRGVGTTLLAQLIAEAETAGRAITLNVETTNAVRGWYERLGFVGEGDLGGAYVAYRRATQPKTAS